MRLRRVDGVRRARVLRFELFRRLRRVYCRGWARLQ